MFHFSDKSNIDRAREHQKLCWVQSVSEKYSLMSGNVWKQVDNKLKVTETASDIGSRI